MQRFLTGLRSYWDAWWLVSRTRMWPLLVIPGLVALLYFPIVGWLAWYYAGPMAEWLREQLPVFLKHPVLATLINIGLAMLGLYLGFILFRNAVMILYAPVLGYLSAKTEANTNPGIPRPDPEEGMLRAARRAILMSLTSLALAITCFVLCVVLLIVPIIGQLATGVALPLSQMFLAGHGFIDPTLERRGTGIRESFRFAWRHRLFVIGCGCGFVVLSLVPVIGWFLAPTLGVVAGTLLVLKLLK